MNELCAASSFPSNSVEYLNTKKVVMDHLRDHTGCLKNEYLKIFPLLERVSMPSELTKSNIVLLFADCGVAVGILLSKDSQ